MEQEDYTNGYGYKPAEVSEFMSCAGVEAYNDQDHGPMEKPFGKFDAHA